MLSIMVSHMAGQEQHVALEKTEAVRKDEKMLLGMQNSLTSKSTANDVIIVNVDNEESRVGRGLLLKTDLRL